jgi:LacI family transcriptional regulator
MKPPKSGQPTIYDVASSAGVSISTVSRVLNSPDNVREETRNRVLSAIDQLGFVPKADARARAQKNLLRIGVLTPFFTAPSFVERLRGVDSALADMNYELVVYSVDSLNRLQGYLAALPFRDNLDGLIIMALRFDETNARRFSERGLEVVSILAGFRSALGEANIRLPDEYVRSSSFQQKPTRQAARDLLTLLEPPTAVFAAADTQAIGVLKVAQELGLRVPEDLAILGFDDLDLSEFIGLTTIRQHLDESGRVAIDLLLSRIGNPDRPIQHVQLPLEVVERDTC